MQRIDFPASRLVVPETAVMLPPTWSWIAYTGAIDYFDLEFGGVEWVDGVSSPWTSVSDKALAARGPLRLRGKARRFRIDDGILSEKKAVVVLDIPDEPKQQEQRVMVLGRDQLDVGGSRLLASGGSDLGSRRNYVLFIGKKSLADRGVKGDHAQGSRWIRLGLGICRKDVSPRIGCWFILTKGNVV